MKDMIGLFSSIAVAVIAVIVTMFSACRNELPKGNELRNIYFAHRQEFDRLVIMLKEDGAFSKSNENQAAAVMLNPLGPHSARDLDFSDQRRQEYKKIFDRIDLQSPALVFGQSESVIFVIAWFTRSLRQASEMIWDAGERQLELAAQTSSAQANAQPGVTLVDPNGHDHAGLPAGVTDSQG